MNTSRTILLLGLALALITVLALTPACYRPAPSGGGQELAGAWVMTRGDSTLAPDVTRPSTSTTGLRWQFEGGRRYTFTYRARVASGALASRFDVTETGRYRLQGDRLELVPAGYDGFVENFFAGNRTRLRDRNPPARRYTLKRHGRALVLEGPCAAFQPNSYCKSGRPVTFTLRPVE